MCDIEGSNTGALLSLNAIGKQDTYLLHDDPEHSQFRYENKRHSDFIKYHRKRNISKPGSADINWPFNETIKVTYNPRNMGDLLSNLYVSFELPPVTDTGYNYADQVGRLIFKSVKMRVDELVVETYHNDWGIIYDQLYLDASEKRTKRYTVNRNLAEGTSVPEIGGNDNKLLSGYTSKVFIPIPFFFSRKYEGDEYETNNPNRPYFPLCAIHKQKIEFEFEFHPTTFFTDYSSLTLDKFDVITEEITLDTSERLYFMNQKTSLMTDIVKKHPSMETTANKDTIKMELVPNIPVKTLFWFFRDKSYEDETIARGTLSSDNRLYHFHNRFNFSASTQWTFTNSFFNPVLDEAKIYINGQALPNITKADHTYFKYIVPFTNRLSRPERNIYTYSFSMNPVNVEPSGSLDFSQLQSSKTVLDIKLKSAALTSDRVYSLHAYYVGYQTFSFENGFMSLAY